ncbi:hypothetical protein C8R45DRAFT_1092468 [Mycena sanguinolenta]|nr:hypothetical protein C8R45DRAFT_1092468 [Mycena sanguinolenta]
MDSESDPAWLLIRAIEEESAEKYLGWSRVTMQDLVLPPPVPCFSQCGRVGILTVEYPLPVGPQSTCSFCAFAQKLKPFFKTEYQRQKQIDCPAEAVVSTMLAFILQWKSFNSAGGFLNARSTARITTTAGAHPSVKAHTAHKRSGEPSGYVIPLDPAARSIVGFVCEEVDNGSNLFYDGLINGLTADEVSKRIKDELLDLPSDARTECAYPDEVHAGYNAAFENNASAFDLPEDSLSWLPSEHQTVSDLSCGPVDSYRKVYLSKQLKSPITNRPFTIRESTPNHSRTSRKKPLLSPLPDIERMRVGCIEQMAIRAAKKISPTFDRKIYEEALDDILAGIVKHVTITHPRLESIYSAIAQNMDWEAIVTKIASQGSQPQLPDLRKLYKLMVQGDLKDLVTSFFIAIEARAMDFEEMMKMVILRKRPT